MKTKPYDLLLKNLQIIDGTGAPGFHGDLAVCGDKIVGMGKLGGNSRRTINCDGLTVTPGFIDIHNHSDVDIFKVPKAANYTTQGCTTLIAGNCGISAAPYSADLNDLFGVALDSSTWDPGQWKTFGDYANDLKQLQKAVNIASFVGHGNIREVVMGMKNKQLSPADLKRMKHHVEEAMISGAVGISSGLIFDPGIYAETEELIELCKVVADHRGVYTTHIRNESDLLVDAVLEAVTIGRKSGARVQVSHLKTSGKRNFGLDKTVLDLMTYYRRFGLEITCDTYPCVFGQTGLTNCLPAWTRAEGQQRLVEILEDDSARQKIRNELVRPSTEWENILLDAGFDQTFLTESKKFAEHQGRSISELSQVLQKDPYDTVFHLVAQEPEISVIVGGLGPEDMETVLRHDLSMVCSDAAVVEFGQGLSHPRAYRAFTRVLSKYVREEGLLTLENAVRKMTAMPAWKLGFYDRGIIRPGMKADLSLFDYWQLNHTAEYGDPHHYSTGMEYVFVNGRPVIFEKEFTDQLPGEFIKHNP